MLEGIMYFMRVGDKFFPDLFCQKCDIHDSVKMNGNF